MKIFSQNVIIISGEKKLEVLPMQIPLGFLKRKSNKNDVMRLGERPRSLEGKPWDRQTDMGTDIQT